jgi:hypothetical protein
MEDAASTPMWGRARTHPRRAAARTRRFSSCVRRRASAPGTSVGFVARTSLPYRRYDPSTREPSAAMAIPTIAMVDVLLEPNRYALTPAEARELLRGRGRAVALHGGIAAVAFHPQPLLGVDARHLYAQVVRDLQDAGVALMTAAQAGERARAVAVLDRRGLSGLPPLAAAPTPCGRSAGGHGGWVRAGAEPASRVQPYVRHRRVGRPGPLSRAGRKHLPPRRRALQSIGCRWPTRWRSAPRSRTSMSRSSPATSSCDAGPRSGSL